MISVLYDPLISAVDMKGQVKRYGLLELLIHANQLTDIKANSCTGKLALLRLCMAFLIDAYPMESILDRSEMMNAGCFDRDLLIEYVKRCEESGACFLLDDVAYPFMQASYDSELDKKAEKSVCKIMFDRASGNNHIHIDHRYENQHEVDTATVFEAMLETYLFCPAGLSGASNVNNTPPVYAILHGKNLFETLVLNMVSQDEISDIPYGEGEIAWCRREKVIPDTKAIEMSLLKALTWQPRRLTLKWDEDGLIRRLYCQNGLNFQGNGLWKDPHVLYRQNKDGDLVSIKPELGRELWRDAGALMRGGRTGRTTIPILNIEDVEWPDRPAILDIEMVGLITNNEAILGRVDERLKLPGILFKDDDKADEFYRALEKCERMYRSVDQAVKWQFCHPGDKKKRSAIAQQAGEAFLHGMRSVLFNDYLHWLDEDDEISQCSARYMDAMWEVLDRAVLKNIVEHTGSDVPSIIRQNAVRGKVRKDFKEIWERSEV